MEGALPMSSKWNKKDLKKFNLGLFKRGNDKYKKAAIAALLLSSLTFNLGFAKETEDKDTFEKVYHVYVANSYIGSVSEEIAIQEVIDQKQQEASIEYKEFSIDAGASITVIPEQVFTVEAKDNETIEKLQEAIVVEAQAYALQVNETPIAYVKDLAMYEEAINMLKRQYVSQEDLDKLKASISSTEQSQLQDGETRLVAVTLSEEITGAETTIQPSEIITAEQAVKLLQTGALEQEIYAVQAGDVLGSIAQKHGLRTAELLALNPSITENTVLQIGQAINVTVNKPYVSVEAVYEKFKIETMDFAKVVEEDETMLKGDKVVKQEGAPGKKEVSYLITEQNGQRTERVQTSEEVLAEPENRVVVVGTKVIPSRGTGTFSWPAVGGYISSEMGARWGSYHRGIDIARPSNYTIKASDNGVVTFTGRDGTYGNKVVVNHNNGYETIYAHLSQIDVSVGQVVAQGTAMGVMGSTGRSTGTHLHFEVHKDGSYVNPLAYLE